MSLLSPIDIYCERTDIGLLNEPLNALSNISFFIAAWLLYKIYKTQGTKDSGALLLIALIALVGTGSSLFHTFANGLTIIADVIPIMLFVFSYLWIALGRMTGFSVPYRASLLAALAGAMAAAERVPSPYDFNHSIGYFPCLAAIILIALHLHKKAHPAFQTMQQAALCFAVSLTLRSIDQMVCPALGIGTHFLWHLINGAVLYLLVRAVLKTPAEPAN